MYCSNKLSECNFTEVLVIQSQISNLPAVDLRNLIVRNKKEVYSQTCLTPRALPATTAISFTWPLQLLTTNWSNKPTHKHINTNDLFLSPSLKIFDHYIYIYI